MFKYLRIILVGVAVSFFFFPFEFTILPGVNTKMMMAALGLVFAVWGLARQRSLDIPRNILMLFVFSGFISIAGVASVVFNRTSDLAYATYIRSAAIWMSAAFAVCCLIKANHGRITVGRACDYLIGVSVAQCILALMIDNIPAMKLFVDAHIQQGQALLNEMERMYGIGASLDVAGSRFAACIAMTSVLFFKGEKQTVVMKVTYAFCAVLIVVVGNMIARTTIVGLLLAALYFIYRMSRYGVEMTVKKSTLKSLGIFLLLAVVIYLYLSFEYAHSATFREHIRFAFEGFFNWMETGVWTTDSSEKLKTMVVFPESFKTWIIGDGYFENPRGDINYVGDSTTEGYYMGTDIGYLRFIFYFGLIGLLAFCFFIIYVAFAGAEKQPEYAGIFALVAACNFIVWFKVSTDLFLVLAILICAADMATPPEPDAAEEEPENNPVGNES